MKMLTLIFTENSRHIVKILRSQTCVWQLDLVNSTVFTLNIIPINEYKWSWSQLWILDELFMKLLKISSSRPDYGQTFYLWRKSGIFRPTIEHYFLLPSAAVWTTWCSFGGRVRRPLPTYTNVMSPDMLWGQLDIQRGRPPALQDKIEQLTELEYFYVTV